MKRLCLTFIMFIALTPCFAPSVTFGVVFLQPSIKVITERSQRVKNILLTTIHIEKPRTIGQAKRAEFLEDAVGILQIRPIAVEEANRIVGYNKFTLEDRRDSIKSVEIFFVIQSNWNPKFNVKKAALLWNGGSNYKDGSIKKQQNLQKYWKKFYTYYTKINKRNG